MRKNDMFLPTISHILIVNRQLLPESVKDSRLDMFLTDNLIDHSRSFIQSLINKKNVHVNGEIVKKNGFKVKNGDTIDISVPVQKTIAINPIAVDFDVVYEHKDFLIINKPAGLLVHPAQSCVDQVSLVNGLVYFYEEFNTFDRSIRPGIVHRLDKYTSGLIIVARNFKAQQQFIEMFKKRSIKKTYLAVLKGHLDKEISITKPIGRHPEKRHTMTSNGLMSKTARTDMKALVYYENATLVSAKPITGRTHQIRVHAQSIQHSILGDHIYGYESSSIKRQALHAHRLAFEYNGEHYQFCQPMPKDMCELLASMKKVESLL